MSEKNNDLTGSGGVYYADGEAVPPVDGHRGRGHLYFGFCCDMRRSVIIVNIVHIIMSLVGLVMVAVMVNYVGSNYTDGQAVVYDDDYMNEVMAAQYGEMQASQAGIFKIVLITTIVMTLLSIAFSGLGIYGALQYNKCMVITAAVWHGISALLSISQGNLFGVIMSGCFIYPHIIYVQELQKGIMTVENYPNEKHSCCCV